MKNIILSLLPFIILLSCSKEQLKPTNVEVVSIVLEKSGSQAKKFNCAIYDDIGASYYSPDKSPALPIRWNAGYKVPNFKNLYSVSVNAVDSFSREIIHFNVNFSKLHSRPTQYIYESETEYLVLVLRWY